MGRESWGNNYPRDLSRLQLVTKWAPNSVGFLIYPYSLSMILSDLEGLIWCAPIIEVVNMNYTFSSPTRSSDLELHENLGPQSGHPKVTTTLFLVLGRQPILHTMYCKCHVIMP